MKRWKLALALMTILTVFGLTSPQGSAQTSAFGPQPAPLCNKCSGSRFCYPCDGTGFYYDDPCAICSGSGRCYYCSGTGRL